MLLRVAVVIPVHGHLRTISEVVKDVILRTPFPILLLDNGSETPVSNALYSFEVKQALESGRLRLIRFESQTGKGVALRSAIGELVKQGYTHMVTLAADGRVPACEIVRLVAEAKVHPWDLIVGSPRGSEVEDFRLYPLFALQNLNLIARNHEFDVEVLIRLRWRRFGIRVVEVVERRAEIEEPGSLIARVLDFARMGLFLLIYRLTCLWLESDSPWIAAGASGAGIWAASLMVRDVESTGLDSRWRAFAGSMALGLELGLTFALIAAFVMVYRRRRELARGTRSASRGTVGEWMLTRTQFRLGTPGVRLLASVVAFIDYLAEPGIRRGLNEYYFLRDRRSSYWRRIWLVFRHFVARGMSRFETVPRLRVTGLTHLQGLAVEQQGGILSCSSLGCWLQAETHLTRQVDLSGFVREKIDFNSVSTVSENNIELVYFMGRLAPVDTGVFLRLARRQVPVILVFSFRGEGGVFEVYARPPRVYRFSGTRPARLEALDWARDYMTLLEGFLKKYPDQWRVDYPFWSTLPRVTSELLI
jgi:hypothetical protein